MYGGIMIRTLTWLATAVTVAVPVTLILCRLNSKRRRDLLNRRYDTDEILFDL
jgi:hypothetical protein